MPKPLPHTRLTLAEGWRWIAFGAPLAVIVAAVAIAIVTAWRAIAVVRPPRLAVDSTEVDQALPQSAQVSFTAPDGIDLKGNYAPSRNGAVVILVHGLFANRTQLLPEARLLSEHGYGVLVYDNRAHGASGGSTATWGQLESTDVRTAVDYVTSREGQDARIGLFGFSIGGTAVLREAVDDQRIRGIVVESTYSSMGAEIRYMFSRYGPFSELPALWTAGTLGQLNYSELVAQNLVCSLNSRPLLLVYGTGDADVPPGEAQRMAQAACSPSSLLMINADTHGGYMDAEAARYSEVLLSFYDSALLGR